MSGHLDEAAAAGESSLDLSTTSLRGAGTMASSPAASVEPSPPPPLPLPLPLRAPSPLLPAPLQVTLPDRLWPESYDKAHYRDAVWDVLTRLGEDGQRLAVFQYARLQEPATTQACPAVRPKGPLYLQVVLDS